MKPNKNHFRKLDCPVCGGSGGGPEHFRCQNCDGYGQVVDEDEYDRAYDYYIDAELDRRRGK